MLKLHVSIEDLSKQKSQDSEQLWRSLEHFLEKQSREFEFDDARKTVSISVADENDALLLVQKTPVIKAELFLVDGSIKIISGEVKKVSGRPRNMVFDSSIGKGMTLNQYAKHVTEQSIAKAEIVKKGILTKAKLEKAIVSGQVSVVSVGSQQRVTKVSLQAYLSQ